MLTNVNEYLENTAVKYPEKVAFVDENRSITFNEIKNESDHVAIALIKLGYRKSPVAVFLDKSVECVPAFMGVIKSGNFYSPIDTKMPVARIEKIFNTLNPVAVVTSRKNLDKVSEFANGCEIIVYEEALKNQVVDKEIKASCDKILDSDLLYVLFTSGSTGIPKGVMISERGLIDFAEWATECFNIDENYVFGNQTPFYFSFSIYEIYLTLKNAATTYIIPHEHFSYPANLMEYLYENKINTLIWVPSALSMLSAFRALSSPHLDSLKRVWFGAEVMPVKQLNRWMDEYPNVEFVNLYGPTEVTDTCTFYRIDKRFENNELLPIGEACMNKEILLLNEDDKLVLGEEIGELCVRGTGLAYGYYNDPERTAEVFVQNPLNKNYNEIIYRTGDLAKFNEDGILVYISRKDFQIKHMGRRIELGEIEANVSSVNGVNQCCCLYNDKKHLINLFYVGTVDENILSNELKVLLPDYMMPNKINRLEDMPINLNGKIDRPKLKEIMQ